eukprot:SAG31_NODE_1760_length_7322_cov_2.480011_5_plen_151_part_00
MIMIMQCIREWSVHGSVLGCGGPPFDGGNGRCSGCRHVAGNGNDAVQAEKRSILLPPPPAAAGICTMGTTRISISAAILTAIKINVWLCLIITTSDHVSSCEATVIAGRGVDKSAALQDEKADYHARTLGAHLITLSRGVATCIFTGSSS